MMSTLRIGSAAHGLAVNIVRAMVYGIWILVASIGRFDSLVVFCHEILMAAQKPEQNEAVGFVH